MESLVLVDGCVVMPLAKAMGLGKPPGGNIGRYLDPTSKAYYLLASDQITIFPSEYPSLTEEGKNALQQARSRDPTKVMTEARIEVSNSGSWFPNEQSPYWEKTHFKSLNTWDNRVLIGKIEGKEEQVQTSPLEFYEINLDNITGWATTFSGSKYQFTLHKPLEKGENL